MAIETSPSIENLAAALGRFETKFIPEPNTGCWLWDASIHHLGYGQFMHRGKLQKAHRMAWRLYTGEIPIGQSVLHKCDVRNCVNPEHLFLGTQGDNIADMVAKRRHRPSGLKGMKIGGAKATDDLVREIRYCKRRGISQNAIAQATGLSPMTISRIIRGETWSHVHD